MDRMTTVLLILAAVGGVFLALLVGNEPTAQSRDDRATVLLQELAGRVAELEQRVVRIPFDAPPRASTGPATGSVSAGSAVVPAADAGPRVEVAQPSPAEPELPEERQYLRERYRAALDDRLGARGIDPEASQNFSSSAVELLSAFEEDAVSIEDTTCSDAICRMVARHPDRDSQDRFLNEIQGHPGFDGEGIAHVEPDGLTFIYVAPNGGRLPELPSDF